MSVETELRKEPCVKCDGVGHLKTQKSIKCSNCKGIGWTEPEKGKEQLCEECLGYGVVDELVQTPCSACDSKGYTLHIYEITEEQVNCPDCNGDGVLCEKIKCQNCNGIGSVPSSLNGLSGCPKCSSYGLIAGEKCTRCGGLGLVDFETGQRCKTKTCKVCAGIGYKTEEHECERCSHSGKVLEITEEEITRK